MLTTNYRSLVFLMENRAVTEREIEIFERSFGITLPNDYRKFLTTANGGLLEPSPDRDFECGPEIVPAVERFRNISALAEPGSIEAMLRQPELYRIPQGAVPIADNGYNDLFILHTEPPFSGVWIESFQLSCHYGPLSPHAWFRLCTTFDEFVDTLAIAQKSAVSSASHD